jgi:hypothetical protein
VGLTLNADGTITVNANTKWHIPAVAYEICEVGYKPNKLCKASDDSNSCGKQSIGCITLPTVTIWNQYYMCDTLDGAPVVIGINPALNETLTGVTVSSIDA